MRCQNNIVFSNFVETQDKFTGLGFKFLVFEKVKPGASCKEEMFMVKMLEFEIKSTGN